MSGSDITRVRTVEISRIGQLLRRPVLLGAVFLFVFMNGLASGDGLYFQHRNVKIPGSTPIDNSSAVCIVRSVKISLLDVGEEIEESGEVNAFPRQFSSFHFSTQSWVSPDMFLSWDTGKRQGHSDIIIIKDLGKELPVHHVAHVHEGQAPTEMLRLDNVFCLGNDILGLYSRGKIILRDFDDGQPPFWIGKIDAPMPMVKTVAFNRELFLFPQWLQEKGGRVLFQTTYKWNKKQLIKLSQHFIRPETARTISGELWEMNQGSGKVFSERYMQALLHVSFMGGFEAGEYFYFNPASGILLKAKGNKFSCDTWLDREKTNRRLAAKGESYLPTHIGIVRAVRPNPVTREIWLMRSNCDKYGNPQFVHDRKTGKALEQNFPMFDILDENLHYKYSIRFQIPAEYIQFTPVNFFCTGKNVMYMYAFAKYKKPGQSDMKLFKIKFKREQNRRSSN